MSFAIKVRKHIIGALGSAQLDFLKIKHVFKVTANKAVKH